LRTYARAGRDGSCARRLAGPSYPIAISFLALEVLMPDWTAAFYEPAHLAGRLLFSLVFIMSGLGHLTQTNAMAGYAASKGVPAAKAATIVTGVMIVAGGLLVALGWHRFIGAGLLVIFVLPTAFVMHAFWRETDPMTRAGERAHFLKDLALAGAALLVAYYAGGDWPFALGAP
jgi:uncharacterized membrane protein YphA (DoxX/SURF4 family)